MLGVYQPYPSFPFPAKFSVTIVVLKALYSGHWFSVWFIIMHVSKLQPSMNDQHSFEALYGGQQYLVSFFQITKLQLWLQVQLMLDLLE